MAAYTTIDDPEAYFQTKLYTGTGSSNAQTFDGDTDMQPDMVWVKSRTYTDHNMLSDAARGATVQLYVNDLWVEETQAEGLKSFDSDGFTVGTRNNWNRNTQTFAAWCWNTQGGAGSSNTTGGINTTTTSVGTTQGFSISTFTGTGSNATIGHGIGAKPGCIIVKQRGAESRWQVYLSTLGATKNLQLDDTSAINDDATRWQDTEPTTTVFSLGTNERVNASSGTYVAYCWAPVQGYSKFGSYTGNGNSDGTFVYTGFRPAYLLVKNSGSSSSSAGWYIFDNKRPGHNLATPGYMEANATTTEATDKDMDLLSNGFKFRLNSTGVNLSGSTYIYAAFAEAPFVNSNGVPCNAR